MINKLFVAQSNIRHEGHTRSMNFYNFLKLCKISQIFMNFKTVCYEFSIYEDCDEAVDAV